MSEEKETITRHFNCKACGKTHKIELNKDLIEGRSKYPFPYVFLHNKIEGQHAQELITILYIDKNLKIRHSEVQELAGEDSIFSKEQVVAITEPLLEEIKLLRDEIETLTDEINRLKGK